MLAWSEELITDVRKPEIMVMTSLQAESYLLITQSPRKLSLLNLKLKSTGAGRYQLLSCWWMPTASSLPERLLSEKSGRCGIAAD